jgi:hypothetical protein
MSATTSTPTTVTHRYPWSLEELSVLAVLAVAPVGVLLWRGTDELPLVAVVTAACWVAFAGLVRLGHRRKSRSRVTATLDGTRLVVSGGRVGSSRGDVAGTRRVSVVTKGPETVLQLTHRTGALLEVPTRVSGDPRLAAVLREHLRAAGVEVDEDARRHVEAL